MDVKCPGCLQITTAPQRSFEAVWDLGLQPCSDCGAMWQLQSDASGRKKVIDSMRSMRV